MYWRCSRVSSIGNFEPHRPLKPWPKYEWQIFVHQIAGALQECREIEYEDADELYLDVQWFFGDYHKTFWKENLASYHNIVTM